MHVQLATRGFIDRRSGCEAKGWSVLSLLESEGGIKGHVAHSGSIEEQRTVFDCNLWEELKLCVCRAFIFKVARFQPYGANQRASKGRLPGPPPPRSPSR